MQVVHGNNSRERVLYIEYRDKRPVKALTISERGVINTWAFLVASGSIAGMEYQLIGSDPGGDIKNLPYPKVSAGQNATYWMVGDAHFKKRGRTEIIPKNIIRQEKPHWGKTAFGERTRNPFETAEKKDNG